MNKLSQWRKATRTGLGKALAIRQSGVKKSGRYYIIGKMLLTKKEVLNGRRRMFTIGNR